MPGTKLILVAFAAGRLLVGQLEDGVAAYNAGRYSTALTLLQGVEGRQAQVFLALSQAATDNCKSALPTLLPIAREATDELGLQAGLAAAKCEGTASALLLLDTLKQRFPRNADVLYLSAEIEMKAFNDTTFAMFRETASSYRTHQLSAEILEIQERFADAVSEYKKAIELNPRAPDLHYRLGRAILLRSHSPEALTEAAAAFATELRLSPEDSACYFQLGQIAQVQGNSANAVTQFEKALELSPNFVNAMTALAKLHLQQNEAARALPLLRKAITMQPDNEAAHYALLTAYRNVGKMDEARQEKAILDRLQKPPDSEFADFLKKLGNKAPPP